MKIEAETTLKEFGMRKGIQCDNGAAEWGCL
jgi:hypothetical protein